MGLDVRVAGQTRPRARLCKQGQGPRTAERRSQRHAGYRDPVNPPQPSEQIDPIPQGRQFVLHRRQRSVAEVELGGHEHHPLRRDPIELVGIHIGVKMGDDIAQVVPGADDLHDTLRLKRTVMLFSRVSVSVC